MTNKVGETPLYIAANLSNLECVKLLLVYNAYPNYKCYGLTPLYSAVFPYGKLKAVQTCNTAFVKLFVEHEANPNIPNIYGSTPLYSAVRSGKTEYVQLLLEHNGDPQIANVYGDSLLDIANQLGYTECAQLLSRHGAEVGREHTCRWLRACWLLFLLTF